MDVLPLVLWVIVIAASIVGLASRDWRAYGVTLGAALLAVLIPLLARLR